MLNKQEPGRIGPARQNKSELTMKRMTAIATALLALSAGVAFAQPDDGGGAPPPPGRHHHPMLPLVRALDTNRDGIIDANEIANAPAALKTLDKNGDGQLTVDEYMPMRPGATNLPAGAQRPPLPLIVKALDANGDGIIDADEIANASAALKTLDKNGDGQLTMDEIMGPRPAFARNGDGGPHRGSNGGANGPGPDQGPPPGDFNGGPPPGGDDAGPPPGPPPGDDNGGPDQGPPPGPPPGEPPQ
jgi:hypothetical protein